MGGPRRLLRDRVVKIERPDNPRGKQKLFFSTLLILPLVASQASAALLTDRDPTRLQPPAITKPKAPVHDCSEEIKAIVLEPHEVIRETHCGKNHTFILTNTSLIIVTPSNEEQADTGVDGITLRLTYTRTDMRDILKHGLVTWTQSEEACYFLTKNGSLRVISVEKKDDDPEYTLPFDVQKAKMILHSNFLFIAAPVAARMVIISLSDKYDKRGLPLLFDATNAEFFVSDGKLYFGEKDGKKATITINGQRIKDIEIVEEY
jgi:hypothetical protein